MVESLPPSFIEQTRDWLCLVLNPHVLLCCVCGVFPPCGRVSTPLIPFSHPLLTLDEVRNPRLIPDNTALTVQGDDAQQGRGDAHLHGKGFHSRQVTPDALAGTDRASRITPSSAWVAGPSPGTKGTAGGKCLGRRPFSLDHEQGRWRGAVPTPALAAVSGRLRAVLRALPEVLGAAGPAQRPPHGRALRSPRERPRPVLLPFPGSTARTSALRSESYLTVRFWWDPKGSRVCHPKMCFFGILVIIYLFFFKKTSEEIRTFPLTT